jgi:hypothetical protein
MFICQRQRNKGMGADEMRIWAKNRMRSKNLSEEKEKGDKSGECIVGNKSA